MMKKLIRFVFQVVVLAAILALALGVGGMQPAAAGPADAPARMPTNYAVPELIYYKFDVAGPTVANNASAPVGSNPAVVNVLTQGGAGQFGTGLIGTGAASSTDYVDTGWATNLGSGDWTISLWLNNIGPSGTLFYFFGDLNAGSFRCFTNGVAGPDNLILRGGGLADVLVTGALTTQPAVVHFVYDSTAGNVKAYVNGVLNNTVDQGVLSITGAGPFKVNGYSTTVGLPAAGVMDEFRVYNRALDSTEIAATWNQTLPVDMPCTATVDGNWSAPATWNCGHVPQTGETVVIGVPRTVTLDVDTADLLDVDLAGGMLTNNGAAHTISLTGNWTNDGIFTPGSLIGVTFKGTGGQSIGGSAVTSFFDIFLESTSVPTLDQSAEVLGTLTLDTDLVTGANVLTMGPGAASAGTGDVVGTVRRTDLGAAPVAFGNPYVTIAVTAGTAPTQMDVTLDKAQPGGFVYAVDRMYTLTPTGGVGYVATVRLHYLDAELHLAGGATEANLNLFRYDGASWVPEGRTANSDVDNWVEFNNVTTFSDWTISGNSTTAVTVTSVEAQAAAGPTLLGQPLPGLALPGLALALGGLALAGLVRLRRRTE